MNMRRNAAKRVGEAVAGGNQAPPQSPSDGVEVLVNPAALKDGEVREALVQMVQAITTQAHGMTTQATRVGASRKNPYASTMATKLKYFTIMNP